MRAHVRPHSAIDPPHSSPVANQLLQGFPWLHFEPVLEAEYERENFEQGRIQLRLNLTLALGLVLAFIAMDRLVVPAAGPHVNALRYGVIMPSLLLALAITFLPHAARLYRHAIAILAPLILVAIAGLVLGAGRAGSETLFPVLVLACVFIYYLVGLSFYSAVRSNLVALAAFVAGASWVDLPAEQTSYQAMVLFFTNLVGATVSYNLDMARRTGWLEARLLAEMAERDGLTGTFNRRRLDVYLRRAWQQGIREQRPMALLMVDIDFFKAYNDHYGHQSGDEALKSVASVLGRAARRPLDFVARYGGEEFLVVLYDTTREHAADLAARIVEGVRALRIPHPTSSASRVLTVSIGVAWVIPVASRSPEGFVQLADEALYEAKHAGRDRVHVMAAEYEQLRTGSFRVVNG